jgi:nitroreductase
MDPEPMLRYVHQWQDVRRMWDEPQGPVERAAARADADREYGRLAMENIRLDLPRHIWRRLTRGVLLLWITDIPIRHSDINSLPVAAIRAMWAAEALLMAAAAVGLLVLWRREMRAESAAFAAVLLYVTAVHAVLFSEPRYSLPAKPVVLLLATIAVAHWLQRSSRRPAGS